jgi:hypothetical protein
MKPKSPHEYRDWILDNAGHDHFDHDEIDRRLVDDGDIEAAEELRDVWERQQKCSDKGEILLRLVDLLIPTRITKSSAKMIGLKVLALGWMIGSGKGNIGSKSQSQIAAKLDVTRAILSFWVRHFEKSLGFHARGQKQAGAVQSYQEASGRGWATRRERIAADDEADLGAVAD